MTFTKAKHVRVVMPRQALELIFDECDRFDEDETGGRLLGTFVQQGDKLTLNVAGIIEAGPKARRSRVSFFQDGEHQEKVFRQLEETHPNIEHLGNWHTHHVNGLSHLSGGDLETYGRTVNHAKQNCPFFYALLVVDKVHNGIGEHRYTTKHYLFRPNDDRVYEIPRKLVKIVDTPLLAPTASDPINEVDKRPKETTGKLQRVYDRDILGEFFEGLRPFSSEKLGVYWRGPIKLVDGSEVSVVVVENAANGSASYSVVLRSGGETFASVAAALAEQEFPSARAALVTTERQCNRVLYELQHGRPLKR